MDPSDPGMHATDTIDFEVVLEGTVVLELDDGAEVTLQRRRHRRAERHPAPVEEPRRQAGSDGAVHLRRRPRDGASAGLTAVLGKPRSERDASTPGTATRPG